MSGLDKVVDRIQKLRRLAESTNLNEAAQAAAEAQRLMSAHRISEAQIASESGAADETVTDVEVMAALGLKTPQSWVVNIAGRIADANGCKIVIRSAHRRSGAPGGIKMFGRASDLDAARYLFNLMVNEINRLAGEWTAANPGQGRGATISFKFGASQEIGRRMVAESKAASDTLKVAADLGSANASGALLVINRSVAAVEDTVKKYLGPRGGSTWGGSGPSNIGAYQSGVRAGASVNLGGSRGRLGSSPKAIGSGS